MNVEKDGGANLFRFGIREVGHCFDFLEIFIVNPKTVREYLDDQSVHLNIKALRHLNSWDPSEVEVRWYLESHLRLRTQGHDCFLVDTYEEMA